MTMHRKSTKTRSGMCIAHGLAVIALLLVSSIDPQSVYADAQQQQFLFAYKLLENKDNDLAAEAFDEYLSVFKDGAYRHDAAYYRALLYRKAGKPEQGLNVLDDVGKPKLITADAINLLRGQLAGDLGRYGQAIQYLEAIDVEKLPKPTAASVAYLRGLMYRKAGNLDAAAASLTRAAKEQTPVRSMAELELGKVQIVKGQYKQAIEPLTKATTASNARIAAQAWHLLGEANYNLKDYDQALAAYSKVITAHQSSPKFGPAVIGAMWSAYSADNYAKSIELFNQHGKSLAENQRLTAIYLAGSAAREMGDHKRTIQLLGSITQAPASNPLLEKALFKLAASQLDLEMYDEMATTVQRLANLYPQSPLLIDAAFMLAAGDAKSGNLARGAARLTELIEQGPDNPYHMQALLRRARLYEQADRLTAAAADYRQYLQTAKYEPIQGAAGAPGEPAFRPTQAQEQAFVRLIGLYHKLEQFALSETLAALWLGEMKLEPAIEQEAMYRRSVALIRLGRYSEADSQLDKLQKKYPVSRFAAAAAYYRGVILVGRGRPTEAQPLLVEAAANQELEQSLRENALRLLATWHREQKQADQVANMLRQLEKLSGRAALSINELIELAAHALATNEPNEALGYADAVLARQQAIADTPAVRSQANFIRGQALATAGKYELAQGAFERVIEIGRGMEAESKLALGQVLAKQDQYKQSNELLEPLLSAQQSPIAAHALFQSSTNHMALAEQAQRNNAPREADEYRAQARRLLKRLILLYSFRELEPLPQQANILLAKLQMTMDLKDQATDDLKKFVETYPADDPYVLYAKALQSQLQLRYGEALSQVKALGNQQVDRWLTSKVDQTRKVLEAGR